MKAYVAVQKKLLLLAYALWRHQTPYAPLHSIQGETAKLMFGKPERNGQKIVPIVGTTQDQSTVVELSFG